MRAFGTTKDPVVNVDQGEKPLVQVRPCSLRTLGSVRPWRCEAVLFINTPQHPLHLYNRSSICARL